MTDQQTENALDEAVEQPPARVEPVAGSRLEQMHAAYSEAKAASAAATKQLKAITDAIKLELTTAAPDQARIDLVGASGVPLRLAYTTSWRLDAKKLKAEDPETYVRYAEQGGTWVLKAVGGVE